jgi:hypothetical protein
LSRLVEGLREASGKDHIWVAIRCSPFHTASAFHPIIEHLKRVFGWQPEDTAQQHLAKLEAGLGGFKTLPLSESVRLFADLMSVPAPEDCYPPLPMTAQQQRDATLDAIVAWLIELAEGTPVLMAWEDLHWADPTTRVTCESPGRCRMTHRRESTLLVRPRRSGAVRRHPHGDAALAPATRRARDEVKFAICLTIGVCAGNEAPLPS